ncbi:ankyrin repeat domain-containing protein 61-like isoform X2 [Girardinichthys multiradiatus]|uniref:ankyrin repeat domain-containing protein 61-like isoform X2 n=1 Tax=Girardinichthys multiradiatus TaxID=208333 RepID=UPI001FAC87AA|nr:ankyrin repeat domain-containing protein 61-like isoform X2 [Girardinichthys multiradiatus]
MCEEQSKGKVNKIYSNGFYSAVMDEDIRGIEGMVQKNGANCQIEIQDAASGGLFWKCQAIVPLHLAASYRRARSMQSLLSAGADAEIKDQLGRTSLHLVIINWPIIPTTGPKPYSEFWTTMTSAGRKGEACLRLLCEHGVNVNAQMDEKASRRLFMYQCVTER